MMTSDHAPTEEVLSGEDTYSTETTENGGKTVSRLDEFMGSGGPKSPPKEISMPIGSVYKLDGRAKFPRQKMLVDRFIGEEMIVICAGERKNGKSYFALHCAKDLVERRRDVLYLDFENGVRRMNERIASMGGDPDNWEEHFYYSFRPKMSSAKEDAEAFEKTLDEIKPVIVIFDSFAGFLVAAGLNENESGDITQWSKNYLAPLRERRISGLVIDHKPHNANRSRGSARKGEEVDATLLLNKVEAFDRQTVGEVKVVCESDRDGTLPRVTKIRIGGEGGKFVFDILNTSAFGLSGQLLAMLQVLQREGQNGMTNAEWKAACEKAGIPKNTFSGYVKTLKDHRFGDNAVLRHEDKKYFPEALDDAENDHDEAA